MHARANPVGQHAGRTQVCVAQKRSEARGRASAASRLGAAACTPRVQTLQCCTQRARVRARLGSALGLGLGKQARQWAPVPHVLAVAGIEDQETLNPTHCPLQRQVAPACARSMECRVGPRLTRLQQQERRRARHAPQHARVYSLTNPSACNRSVHAIAPSLRAQKTQDYMQHAQGARLRQPQRAAPQSAAAEHRGSALGGHGLEFMREL